MNDTIALRTVSFNGIMAKRVLSLAVAILLMVLVVPSDVKALGCLAKTLLCTASTVATVGGCISTPVTTIGGGMACGGGTTVSIICWYDFYSTCNKSRRPDCNSRHQPRCR